LFFGLVPFPVALPLSMAIACVAHERYTFPGISIPRLRTSLPSLSKPCGSFIHDLILSFFYLNVHGRFLVGQGLRCLLGPQWLVLFSLIYYACRIPGPWFFFAGGYPQGQPCAFVF
jgi:hypothetical protein